MGIGALRRLPAGGKAWPAPGHEPPLEDGVKAMTTRVILSAVGSDRPGLTQSLAEAVLAAGGNWLESHLSRLGGKYVGSVLVELEEDRIPTLEARIREVDASGLHVSLVP